MQKEMAFVESITKSELIAWSFELRKKGFSSEESSEIVGKLIERFILGRCGFIASVAARLLGREHYVSWHHPDGRLAHAVLAVAPQFDDGLRGDGIDILGRRPLHVIGSEIAALSPRVRPMVGEVIPSEYFDPDEEDELLTLISALPWYARVVRVEKGRVDDLRSLTFLANEVSRSFAT